MKILLSFLATAAITSADTLPAGKLVPVSVRTEDGKAAALTVGSAVTIDALAKGEWIQGEAPKAWEPGKVYILECWATWCGPCIAAIPHVNELSKKYADKGLRVCGMNVWERGGKQSVVDFVKGKGEGMSYPVSYNEKGGLFDIQWLTPAGVSGIPHAFVVKDGKIVMMSHPSQLTNEVIEALIAGGDAQEKAISGIAKKQEQQSKLGTIMGAFQAASRKKDSEGMAKAIADLKALDPASSYIPTLELQVLLAKSDWPAVEASINKLESSPTQMMVLMTAARTVTEEGSTAPASLIKAVVAKLAPILEASDNPTQLQMLAKFQWKAGDKDAAIASAKKAVTAASSEQSKKMRLTPAAFVRYQESLEKGTLPEDKEFYGWLREGMSGSGADKTEK